MAMNKEEMKMLGMSGDPQELDLSIEIGKAEEVDEDMYNQLAPRGKFSKKALNNLVTAANRLLPLFEQSPDYPMFEEDIQVFPNDFVRVIGMFQAAVNYAVDSGDLDEEMDFELEDITDDRSIMLLAGKITKLAQDREFKKFLQNPPPEFDEETEEEEMQEEESMPSSDEMDKFFAGRM